MKKFRSYFGCKCLRIQGAKKEVEHLKKFMRTKRSRASVQGLYQILFTTSSLQRFILEFLHNLQVKVSEMLKEFVIPHLLLESVSMNERGPATE